MTLSPGQWGVLRGSGGALVVSAGVLGVGYVWLPAEWFGLAPAMTVADRIAFALKSELFLFLWLAGCVGAVSRLWRATCSRPGSCLLAGDLAAPKAVSSSIAHIAGLTSHPGQ